MAVAPTMSPRGRELNVAYHADTSSSASAF